MLFIVDGTGPYDYEQYDRDFSKSFCSQMFKQKTAFAKYYPGPGTLGISTHVTANICTRDVVKTFTESRKTKIYLAGYSRGGAAVMQVAKWCAGYTTTTVTSAPANYSGMLATQTATPIPIEAMFLLDPVTKDFSVNGIGVPSNVKKCYVMYRDQTIVLSVRPST